MSLDHLPLARQIDMVFREIEEELLQLSSGTVFIQIRNNVIGKFGVRHLPLESKDGRMKQYGAGLSSIHVHSFRLMAVESLKYKKNWTHGEISFDFTMKQNLFCSSVQFESNYNMANLMINLERRTRQKELFMDS